MRFTINRTSTRHRISERPCEEARSGPMLAVDMYDHRRWYIELETLDDLMALAERYTENGLIVQINRQLPPHIEIYDELRE